MKPNPSAVNEIGIVLYPGVQASSVHGLTDLFELASRFSAEQLEDRRSRLRLTHWEPLPSSNGALSCVYDSEPRATGQPRVLIIPPTLDQLPEPEVRAVIASWLRGHHAKGSKLACVCSGAFVLAETGLLAGRSISTHPRCATLLTERFPDISVDMEKRVIDDGDLITAGGFMAWIDIGLIVVDRMLGNAVRAEIARFILADPVAKEARYFAGFAPRQTHGDTAVLIAQDWVHLRDGRNASLASMAAVAGLEKRTFHRRFARATGMTPMEYCRAVRVARARELLEFGNMPVKRIAASLDYADVASFARAFRKEAGMAPGTYRKQFGPKIAVHPG